MGHSIVSNNSDSCDLNFAKTFPKPQVGPHEFALSIWDFNLKDWPHSGIFSSQQVATPSWNLKTSTSKTLKKILSWIYIMGSSTQTCLCWGLSLYLWCKRIVFEKWIDGNVQLTENCCDLSRMWLGLRDRRFTTSSWTNVSQKCRHSRDWMLWRPS